MKTECATPATAIQVNREEVRMLVADLGYDETSKRTGIKSGTLRQWSKRFNWNHTRQHSQVVTTVTQRPAIAHAEALQDMETATRMSLARSARKLATEAESAELRQVGDVHKVAQVMAIVHRQDDQKPGAQFSLNVLNLNIFSDDSTPTLDT